MLRPSPAASTREQQFDHHKGDEVKRRTFMKYTAAGGAGLVMPALALDALGDYPNKPVRIVVGYPPGGATDLIARLVANKLQAALGQPVLVENKPGASSNIATEQVVRSEADGYTLLLGTIANATNMSVYKNVRYDTLRDLAPISLLMKAPSVLVTAPMLPVRNLQELLALAKAKPGELTFSSSGMGGSPHLAGELLKMRAKIDIMHVPYKGGSQALNDTISGVVSMGFKTSLSAIPHIQAGKLKAIAVASDQRLPSLPDVPTMAEAGFADFEVSSWNGLMAPAGTPPAILAMLSKKCAEITAMPDVRESLAKQASIPVGSTAKEFETFVRGEIERWAQVVKAAGVSI
jgi:tripartite-type tricarboxylate transporter receptor subunit TctC